MDAARIPSLINDAFQYAKAQLELEHLSLIRPVGKEGLSPFFFLFSGRKSTAQREREKERERKRYIFSSNVLHKRFVSKYEEAEYMTFTLILGCFFWKRWIQHPHHVSVKNFILVFHRLWYFFNEINFLASLFPVSLSVFEAKVNKHTYLLVDLLQLHCCYRTALFVFVVSLSPSSFFLSYFPMSIAHPHACTTLLVSSAAPAPSPPTTIVLGHTYTPCYCEENAWLLVKDIMEKGVEAELFVIFISNESKAVAMFNQRAGDSRSEGFVLWDYHVIVVAKTREDEKESEWMDSKSSESNDHASAPLHRLMVYDLDTTLPFPTPLGHYYSMAFRPQMNIRSLCRPKFRIVPARDFLHKFASDRSHMRIEGGWSSPPPSYPCIVAGDGEKSSVCHGGEKRVKQELWILSLSLLKSPLFPIPPRFSLHFTFFCTFSGAKMNLPQYIDMESLDGPGFVVTFNDLLDFFHSR